MTQLSYVFSISSTTNVASAGRPMVYISTMSFYVLAVETMYGKTLSPSASNTTPNIIWAKGIPAGGWVST